MTIDVVSTSRFILLTDVRQQDHMILPHYSDEWAFPSHLLPSVNIPRAAFRNASGFRHMTRSLFTSNVLYRVSENVSDA